MADGPGREPPDDRAGRDRHRHPMRWRDDAPHGGFSDGEPWLPAIEVDGGAVATQAEDPDSVLALYRDLIAQRRGLGEGLEFVDAGDGVLAYRRGDRLVAVNLADGPRPAPPAGELLRATHGARHPRGRARATRAGSGRRLPGAQLSSPRRQRAPADSPASCTSSAICTRLSRSSFISSRETCALTVATLMYSSAAISALELPWPTATATSRSRSVSSPSSATRARVARRRAVGGHVVEQPARDRRRQHRVARRDEADRAQDLRRRRVLDEEAGGAVAQRGEDVVVDRRTSSAR